MWIDGVLDRGLVPDAFIRAGIRRNLAARLRAEARDGAASAHAAKMAWIETLRRSPVAIATADANSQHYEVPAPEIQQRLLADRGRDARRRRVRDVVADV